MECGTETGGLIGVDCYTRKWLKWSTDIGPTAGERHKKGKHRDKNAQELHAKAEVTVSAGAKASLADHNTIDW